MKPKITEAAIDHVLARLLTTSDFAVRACLAAVAPTARTVIFDRANVARQVPHVGARGTADIVLRVWSKGEPKALILIENKIDAGFTPDQPARYALCRDAHLADRSAPLVATLLVSPSIYISGSRIKDAFDGVLSYESLLPYLDNSDQALLELAIERGCSPYEPVPIEAVMSFFDGYAAIAAEVAPDIRIKANPNSGNARPKASRTIYFDARASGFQGYPFLLKGEKSASLRVSHQCWDSSAPSASVKLMLDGWASHINAVSPILQPSLCGTGLYIRAAGRSLAIVADTKRLSNMQPAARQRTAIEEALSQLRRIRDAWNGMETASAHAAKSLKQ
jgi:hypothetical protein